MDPEKVVPSDIYLGYDPAEKKREEQGRGRKEPEKGPEAGPGKRSPGRDSIPW